MKESKFYRGLKNEKTQCLACNHYCVLDKNEIGKCGVRKNIDGKIYSLVYGKVCALNIDPIEKKPFYHFLPGSFSLSLATVGCNFSCLNCQNWEISQGPKLNSQIIGEKVSVKRIIQTAKSNQVASISYTYTEPTIFVDFALEIMKEAKKENLQNNWVSNGFMSSEVLETIIPYLDAINIDLKSFSDEFYQKYCGGRLNPILENLKKIKKAGIWLEVTTLIIPTLNDKEEEIKKIANFIKTELGEETPWHITQFSPLLSWKLQELPETPKETLIKFWNLGKKVGLKYVYTGNVPGLDSENTYCPQCDTLLIERYGYLIKRFDKKGICPKCGYKLEGKFK